MITLRIVTTTACFLAATSLAQAASLVPPTDVNLINELDPMDQTQFIQNNGVGIFTTTPLVDNSPFLGNFTRGMTLNIISNPNNRTATATIPGIGSGFALSNGVFQESRGTITYNLNQPVDFTQGNALGIAIDLGIVVEDLEIGITFGSVTQTFTVPADNISPTTRLIFPFSDFLGVDFTSVSSYSVYLDSPPAGDAAFSPLSTYGANNPSVPESSTLFGLLGLVCWGFRKPMQKS